MRRRQSNPDENTRSLERAFLQGDISAREPLIKALAREGNWRRIFEILPKINPVIFKDQEQPLPCGCEIPIPGREIEVPQGCGLLAHCPCDHYYVFLANANSIIEAYESGIDWLYTFLLDVVPGPAPTPYRSPPSGRGYYIGGRQYFCSGVSLGPSFNRKTPTLLPNGWLEIELFFQDGMVHDQSLFLEEFDERGSAPVLAQINPDDLDWWLLLRGISN